jgi:hypothetical protein
MRRGWKSQHELFVPALGPASSDFDLAPNALKCDALAVFMRLSPVLLCAAALSVGACSSPEKKMADAQAALDEANSRRVEEMRMRSLSSGEVQSQHWSKVLVADPTKEFNLEHNAFGNGRSYSAGKARTKEFSLRSKVRTETFRSKDFAGSKTNRAADKEYATSAARTRKFRDSDKKTGDKLFATRPAHNSDKVVPTRDLPDGDRPYLGRESKKMNASIAPETLADWRSGETVVRTGSSVERLGSLKELSVEDVRDILNKNK